MEELHEVSEKKKARMEKKLKKAQAELALKSADPIPSTSSFTSHSKFSVAGVIESLRDASSKVKKTRDGSSQNYPKVILTGDKMKGRAIMTPDILHVQLYSLLHSEAGMGKPKWCHLRPSRAVSQVVLIIVEITDFPPADMQLQGLIQDYFPFCRRYFRDRVLVKSGNLRELRTGLFRVPVSPLQVLKEKLTGSPTVAPRKNAKKTDFLLSVSEMVENNYPLPLESTPDIPDSDPYSLSIPSGYKTVTDSSPVFAIDCEMCLTGAEGKHELTRVSVVDESLRVIYDTLVQPKTPITNYLTKFSGITEKLLKGVVTTVEDVQKALANILPPDAILLGHSLNFDLHALRLYHPYVLDLSVIYNLSGTRQLKSSLSTLSTTFLGGTIQDSKKGHCSIEDSWATMRLFKEKLENGLDYGNVQLGWSYMDFANERGATHTESVVVRKRKHDEVTPENPLDPELEAGKPLPKYQKKSEVGQGVPFSPTIPPGLEWEKVTPKRKPEIKNVESEGNLVASNGNKSTDTATSNLSPSSSRSSTESPEIVPGNCLGCSSTLDHAACRNNGCLCRTLPWLSCNNCGVKDSTENSAKTNSSSNSNSDSASNSNTSDTDSPNCTSEELGMDFSEALGLGDIFSMGNREFDSLGEFLKNRRKKMCLFGNSEFVSRAEAVGNVTGVKGGHTVETQTSDSFDACAESFKLRLLEFDYAVLQMKSSQNPEELEKLDEAISKLHVSIPKKALITMLVVPVLSDGHSLAQKEGLCCLRVKT